MLPTKTQKYDQVLANIPVTQALKPLLYLMRCSITCIKLLAYHKLGPFKNSLIFYLFLCLVLCHLHLYLFVPTCTSKGPRPCQTQVQLTVFTAAKDCNMSQQYIVTGNKVPELLTYCKCNTRSGESK